MIIENFRPVIRWSDIKAAQAKAQIAYNLQIRDQVEFDREYKRAIANSVNMDRNAIIARPLNLLPDAAGVSTAPMGIYGPSGVTYNMPSVSGYNNSFFYQDVAKTNNPLVNGVKTTAPGLLYKDLGDLNPAKASEIYWGDPVNIEKAYLQITANELLPEGTPVIDYSVITHNDAANRLIVKAYDYLKEVHGDKPAAEWNLTSSQYTWLQTTFSGVSMPDLKYLAMNDASNAFYQEKIAEGIIPEFAYQDDLLRSTMDYAIQNGFVPESSMKPEDIRTPAQIYNDKGQVIPDQANFTYLKGRAKSAAALMSQDDYVNYYTEYGMLTGRVQFAELPDTTRQMILSDPRIYTRDLVDEFGPINAYQITHDPLFDTTNLPAYQDIIKPIASLAMTVMSIHGVALMGANTLRAAATIIPVVGQTPVGQAGGFIVGYAAGAAAAYYGMNKVDPTKTWDQQTDPAAKLVMGLDAMAEGVETNWAASGMSTNDIAYVQEYKAYSDGTDLDPNKWELTNIDPNNIPAQLLSYPNIKKARDDYYTEELSQGSTPRGSFVGPIEFKIYRSKVYDPLFTDAYAMVDQLNYELNANQIFQYAAWGIDKIPKTDGYTWVAGETAIGPAITKLLDSKLSDGNFAGLTFLMAKLFDASERNALRGIDSPDDIAVAINTGVISDTAVKRAVLTAWAFYNQAHNGPANSYPAPGSGEVYRYGSLLPVKIIPGLVTKEEDPAAAGVLVQLAVAIVKEARETGVPVRDVARKWSSIVELNIGANESDWIMQSKLDPIEYVSAASSQAVSMVADATGHQVAANAFRAYRTKEMNFNFAGFGNNKRLAFTFGVEVPHFEQSMSIGEGLRRWQSALSGSNDVTSSYDFTKLNWFQRRMAAIHVTDEGKPEWSSGPFTDRSVNDVTPNNNPWTRFSDFMFSLDMVSRAKVIIEKSSLSLSAMLTQFKAPKDFVDFYNSAFFGDQSLIGKIGSNFMFGANVNTVTKPLKAAADLVNKAYAKWERSNTQRELVLEIGRALGMVGLKVVETLSTDMGAAVIFQKLTAIAADQNNKNSALANVLLKRLGPASAAQSKLQRAGDIFNKSKVAFSYEQWSADLGNDISDFVEEYAVKEFGVSAEAKNNLRRFTSALKNMQSLLLLGFSTSYPINNYMDNVVGRASVGVFGYMTPWAINTYMERFEITPPRMGEGVGEMGNTDAAHNRSKHTLDAAMRDGDIPFFSQFVRNIGRFTPGNWAASKIESMESTQAYAIGIRKGMGMFWHNGSMLPSMSKDLTKALNTLHPKGAQIVKNAIQSGLNMNEVNAMVAATLGGRNILSPENILMDEENSYAYLAMLDHLGLRQKLREALANAKSPEEVTAAIANIRKEHQDHIELRKQMGLAAEVEHMSNRIIAEGPRALFSIYIDNDQNATELWLDSLSKLSDAIQAMKDAKNDETSNSAFIDLMEQIQQRYAQMYRQHTLAMYAISQALGTSSQLSEDVRAAYEKTTKIWADAYQEKIRLLTEHQNKFAGQNTDEKWADLEAIRKQIDATFVEAYDKSKKADRDLIKVLAQSFEAMYGQTAKDVFMRSWKKINDYREGMWKSQKKHRKAVTAMTPEERARANNIFWNNSYTGMIGQYEKVRIDAFSDIDAAVQGRSRPFQYNLDATPVPNTPNQRYEQTTVPGQQFISDRFSYSEDTSMAIIDRVSSPMTASQTAAYPVVIDPRVNDIEVDDTYGLGDYNPFLDSLGFSEDRGDTKTRVDRIAANATIILETQERSKIAGSPWAADTVANKDILFTDNTIALSFRDALIITAASNSTNKEAAFLNMAEQLRVNVQRMKDIIAANPAEVDQQMVSQMTVMKGLQREAFILSQRYSSHYETSRSNVTGRITAKTAAEKAAELDVTNRLIGMIRTKLMSVGIKDPKIAEATATEAAHMFAFMAKSISRRLGTDISATDFYNLNLVQIERHNSMAEAHTYTAQEYITSMRQHNPVDYGTDSIVSENVFSDNALRALHWQLVEQAAIADPASVPDRVMLEHSAMSPVTFERSENTNLANMTVKDAFTTIITREAKNVYSKSSSSRITEERLLQTVNQFIKTQPVYSSDISRLRNFLNGIEPNNPVYIEAVDKLVNYLFIYGQVKSLDAAQFTTAKFGDYVKDENSFFRKYIAKSADDALNLIEIPMFGYDHHLYFTGRETNGFGLERVDSAAMTLDNLIRLSSPSAANKQIPAEVYTSYVSGNPIAVERPSITVRYNSAVGKMEVVSSTNVEYARQMQKMQSKNIFIPIDVFYEQGENDPDYSLVKDTPLYNRDTKDVVRELGTRINGYGFVRGYIFGTKDTVVIPGTNEARQKKVIALLDSANATTFLHEMYHNILDYATDEQMDVFNDYLHAETYSGWSREQHELLVTTMEAWRLTAKAPTSALEAAFSALRAEFNRIYKYVLGMLHINVNISEELKAEFAKFYMPDTIESDHFSKEVQAEQMATDPYVRSLYQMTDNEALYDDVANYGFYSKQYETISNENFKKLNTPQIIALLKKSGVKDEEMRVTGLGDFLNQYPYHTKEEVMAFLDTNSAKVYEFSMVDNKTQYGSYDSYRAFDTLLSDYRETLLYVPPTQSILPDYMNAIRTPNTRGYTLNVNTAEFGSAGKIVSLGEFDSYEDFNKLDQNAFITNIMQMNYEYSNPHFTQRKQVIAHIRSTNFVEPTLGKTLMVEEAQSDYFQAVNKDNILVNQATWTKVARRNFIRKIFMTDNTFSVRWAEIAGFNNSSLTFMLVSPEKLMGATAFVNFDRLVTSKALGEHNQPQNVVVAGLYNIGNQIGQLIEMENSGEDIKIVIPAVEVAYASSSSSRQYIAIKPSEFTALLTELDASNKINRPNAFSFDDWFTAYRFVRSQVPWNHEDTTDGAYQYLTWGPGSSHFEYGDDYAPTGLAKNRFVDFMTFTGEDMFLDKDKALYYMDKDIDKKKPYYRTAVLELPGSKSWVDMSVKRMIKYAVDTGKDTMLWPVGGFMAQRIHNTANVAEFDLNFVLQPDGSINYSYEGRLDSGVNYPKIDISSEEVAVDKLIEILMPTIRTEAIKSLGLKHVPFTEKDIDIKTAELVAEGRKKLLNEVRAIVQRRLPVTVAGQMETVDVRHEFPFSFGFNAKLLSVGMINHYDKQMVQAANKLLKPYGIEVDYVPVDNPVDEKGYMLNSKDWAYHRIRITSELKAKYTTATLFSASMNSVILDNVSTLGKLITDVDLATTEEWTGSVIRNSKTVSDARQAIDVMNAAGIKTEQDKSNYDAMNKVIREASVLMDRAHIKILEKIGRNMGEAVLEKVSLTAMLQYYMNPMYEKWLSKGALDEDFAELEYVTSSDVFRIKPVSDTDRKAVSDMMVRVTENGSTVVDGRVIAEENIDAINASWKNRQKTQNPFSNLFEDVQSAAPVLIFQNYSSKAAAFKQLQDGMSTIVKSFGTFLDVNQKVGSTEEDAREKRTMFDVSFFERLGEDFAVVSDNTVRIKLADNVAVDFTRESNVPNKKYITATDILAVHDLIVAARENNIINAGPDAKLTVKNIHDLLGKLSPELKTKTNLVLLSALPGEITESPLGVELEYQTVNGKKYSPYIFSPVDLMAYQLGYDLIGQAKIVDSPNATWYKTEYKKSLNVAADNIIAILRDTGHKIETLVDTDPSTKTTITVERGRDASYEGKPFRKDEDGNPIFTVTTTLANGTTTSEDVVMNMFERVNGEIVEGEYARLSHFYCAITSIGTEVQDQTTHVNNLLMWRFMDLYKYKDKAKLFPIDKFVHAKKASLTTMIKAVETIHKNIASAPSVLDGVKKLITTEFNLKENEHYIVFTDQDSGKTYVRVYAQKLNKHSGELFVNVDKYVDIDTTSTVTATIDVLLIELPAAMLKNTTHYPPHITVPYAAKVLGPKLGVFFTNLYGLLDYPTLDLWMQRALTLPLASNIKMLTVAKTQTITKLATAYVPFRINELETLINDQIAAATADIAAIYALPGSKPEKYQGVSQEKATRDAIYSYAKKLVVEKESLILSLAQLNGYLSSLMDENGAVNITTEHYPTLASLLAANDEEGITFNAENYASDSPTDVIMKKFIKTTKDTDRFYLTGYADSRWSSSAGGRIQYTTELMSNLTLYFLNEKTYTVDGKDVKLFNHNYSSANKYTLNIPGIQKIGTANTPEKMLSLLRPHFTKDYNALIDAGKSNITIEKSNSTGTGTFLVTIEGQAFRYDTKGGVFSFVFKQTVGQDSTYKEASLADGSNYGLNVATQEYAKDAISKAVEQVEARKDITVEEKAAEQQRVARKITSDIQRQYVEYYFLYKGKTFKKEYLDSADAPGSADRALWYTIMDVLRPIVNQGIAVLMNERESSGALTDQSVAIRAKYKVTLPDSQDVATADLEVASTQAQIWGLYRRPGTALTHNDGKYVTSEDYFTGTVNMYDKQNKVVREDKKGAFVKKPWTMKKDGKTIPIGHDAKLTFQTSTDAAEFAGAETIGELEAASREWRELRTESSYFKRWNQGNKIPTIRLLHGGFSANADPDINKSATDNWFGPAFYYTSGTADANKNYAQASGPDRINMLALVKKQLIFSQNPYQAAQNALLKAGQTVEEYFRKIWKDYPNSEYDYYAGFVNNEIELGIMHSPEADGNTGEQYLNIRSLALRWSREDFVNIYKKYKTSKTKGPSIAEVEALADKFFGFYAPSADTTRAFIEAYRSISKIYLQDLITADYMPTMRKEYYVPALYELRQMELKRRLTKLFKESQWNEDYAELDELAKLLAGWTSDGLITPAYGKMVRPFYADKAETDTVELIYDEVGDKVWGIDIPGIGEVSVYDAKIQALWLFDGRMDSDDPLNRLSAQDRSNIEDLFDNIKNMNNFALKDLKSSGNLPKVATWKQLFPTIFADSRPPHANLFSYIARSFGFDGIVMSPSKFFPGMKNVSGAKHYLFFDNANVKSTFNRGTFDPNKSNMMQQDSRAGMATDYYDRVSGYTPESNFIADGYRSVVSPVLDLYEAKARNNAANPSAATLKSNGLDGDMLKQFQDYMGQVPGRMASAKMQSIDYASRLRDAAMLNYNRKYGFDAIMQTTFPYEFWYTRSMINWFFRVLDKPQFMSRYARMLKYVIRKEELEKTRGSSLPERLQSTVGINAPWLPDFLGEKLFIDPSKQLIPPFNLMSPFERMNQENDYQTEETYRVLQEWSQDEKYKPEEINDAAITKAGPIWEEANKIAAERRTKDVNTPLDVVRALFGPAWYLQTPAKLMDLDIPGINKGGKETISETPMLRTSRAFETVTQDSPNQAIKAAGQLVGLLGKPEQWIREQLDLPEFSEYGEYYIKRQLANMVVERLITVDEAVVTMVELSGPIYDAAVQRVRLEQAMRVPLAASTYAFAHDGFKAGVTAFLPSLFSAGLLPKGELIYRRQQELWQEALDAADKGNPIAIKNFFTTFPEYEVYLAKNKEPDELLKSFMIGQIWDYWMELEPKTKAKLLDEVLPPEFEDKFINKETRNYDDIPVQTIADWGTAIGIYVPKTSYTKQGTNAEYAAAVTKANELVAEDTAAERGLSAHDDMLVNRFFVEKKTKYPNISAIQADYFAKPKSERPAYLIQYPQLIEYWGWSRSWKDKYTWLEPYFTGEAYKAYDYSALSPTLISSIETHIVTNEDLPTGTYNMLNNYWVMEGRPNGDFETWLDMVLIPSVKNKMIGGR